MTALSQYQRLESPGIWHESPTSQRRDVYVSFGEATLVIKDQTDMALSHWALAALVRLNPGKTPAIYAPSPDDTERLELDDPDMIEALETVRRAMARAEPHSGRLRMISVIVVLTLVLLSAIRWMPGIVADHTAEVLPISTRQTIGREILTALEPYMGRSCRDRAGIQALGQLSARLLGDENWDIRVLPSGRAEVIALPGRILALPAELLTAHPDAQVVAGHILWATSLSEHRAPLLELTQAVGPRANIGLLSTGQIGDAALARFAKILAVEGNRGEVEIDPLILKFKAAGLSTRDFAMDLGGSHPLYAPLIAQDPFPEGTPRQLMTDRGWLTLQGICES
ncbi:MAG: hypothetical protein ACPGNV_12965 [Mangrovicoccus sp.]